MMAPLDRFAQMLSPERAFLFRLTHRENLTGILEHGVLSQSAAPPAMRFTAIGLVDAIERRVQHEVPIAPGGTLADYVPFYFTPCTPMAYRILTGRGVARRERSELVYLLSSIDALETAGRQYVITDRHALLDLARFAADRSLLSGLPWDLWRRRDFRRDEQDLDKFERYQAEALIHESLPLTAIRAIITADERSQAEVRQLVTASGATIETHVRPEWYPG